MTFSTRLSGALRLSAAALVAFVLARPAQGQCGVCVAPSFGPAPRAYSIRPENLPHFYSDFAQAVGTGDFNSDGLPDLVVSTGFGLVLVTGTGGGRFAPAFFDGPVEMGAALVVADFDGDGHPDVATGNYGPNLVTVFPGDGVGGFRPPRVFTGYASLESMAAGDFDGDGQFDLALASPSEGRVSVLRGLGTGDFVVLGSVSVGFRPAHIAAGDLDGDGLPDLAVADEGNLNGNVYVFKAHPNSMPTLQATFLVADRAGPVAIGDLDGGSPDILVAGFNNYGEPFVQTLSVLHGHGDGSFDAPVAYQARGDVTGLALADIDRDGDLDVAASAGQGHFALYRNDGSGALLDPTLRATGDQSVGIASGDFDGNGRPDFAVAGGYDEDVFVFLTDSDASPEEMPAFEYGAIARGLVLVDMDGNGTLDAVTSNWWSRDIAILPGTGTGSFEPRLSFPNDNGYGTMAVGDLDGDSLPDLVTSSSGAGQFYVVMNLGGNTLGPPTTFESLSGVSPIGLALLNADGFQDLVATSDTSVVIHLGAGDGTFGNAVEIPGTGPGGSAALGDFNLDGKTDIAALNYPSLGIFLGQGDGSFAPPALYPTGGSSAPIVVGDADGDGKPDVITSSESDPGFSILFGDGAGGLSTAVFFRTLHGPRAVMLTDANGDGLPDVVAATGQISIISISAGLGGRAFGPEVLYAAPSSPQLLASGDLDGDGKSDLVAACAHYDYPDGVLAVLRNSRCEAASLALAGSANACAHPGQPFPEQPSLRVIDHGGNTVVCAGGSVTAAIVPGTGTDGATLSGATAAPVIDGVASFLDLSIDLAGTGYALAFSHPAGTTRREALSVGDDPPAPSASSSGTFCPGETVALYATTVPGATYHWTGPAGFISSLQSPTIPSAPAEAAGVYSVFATVGGCSSPLAATAVAVSSPPAGPVVEGETTVCKLARMLLAAQGSAARYQWYRDGTPIPSATAATYTVASAGDADAGEYTVTATSESGCVSLPSSPISVTLIEGCSVAAMDLEVDPVAGAQSNGNGMLEPGESALVVPTWRNSETNPLVLSGTASNLTGPQPAVYVLTDASADYGAYTPLLTKNCLDATGDCYAVSVSTVSGQRPVLHWDVRMTETPSTGDPSRAWTLHVGDSFDDVPPESPLYPFVEGALHAGITAGCGTGAFCPSAPVTRAQMAVFLLRSRWGPTFVPPTATGLVFTDVPPTAFAADWIEQLSSESITAGCGEGIFCPSAIVSRKQMAVFLLRTEHGFFYTPPAATGIFADVPAADPYARWIEALYEEGITAGCAGGPPPASLYFCPESPVTRGQMAVFLIKTFGFIVHGI